MFENLRENQHAGAANLEDPAVGDEVTAVRRRTAGFLGMTSGQRLAVAIMVLISVCLLGTTCLLVTGAIRTF
jgi:hypothetical protein